MLYSVQDQSDVGLPQKGEGGFAEESKVGSSQQDESGIPSRVATAE